jgi:hypothetical protein
LDKLHEQRHTVEVVAGLLAQSNDELDAETVRGAGIVIQEALRKMREHLNQLDALR